MNFHSFGTRGVIGSGKNGTRRGAAVICHMFDRRYTLCSR